MIKECRYCSFCYGICWELGGLVVIMYCVYIRKKIINSDVFMGMLFNCMIF